MCKIKIPKKNSYEIIEYILKMFIEHHNLPEKLDMPACHDLDHVLISKIMDIITYSLGQDKRRQIIEMVEKFNGDLPSHLRG